MSPTLALLLWVVFTLALFIFDPARDRRASVALWIPLIWMFICSTRLPSQWLNVPSGLAIQSMEDGNPFDRCVYLLLIGLSLWVLISRSLDWGALLRNNRILVAFLLFALLSVIWSDFPFITFKRWFRDLENYLAVLVIVTDSNVYRAVGTVLRRLVYVGMTLSILLTKYFPQLGRQYDSWTGAVEYVGAATSKNMLGLLCLVSGLFLVWDTATRWSKRKEQRVRRIIAINLLFFMLTAWVLHQAKSTTSTICLILGSLVILAYNTGLFRRYPKLLKSLVPLTFFLYLILNFVFGMNGSMAQAVGKDATLTDRTAIWTFLLGMHTNPILGVGYQAFWLGSRLETFWRDAGLGHINEAHNGYLQVYLELGIIGVAIIAAFLLDSYRFLCQKFASARDLAVFGMAIWMCLVFYNMSEAALGGGILFTLFLMTAMRAAPVRARAPVPQIAARRAGRAQEMPEYRPPVMVKRAGRFAEKCSRTQEVRTSGN